MRKIVSLALVVLIAASFYASAANIRAVPVPNATPGGLEADTPLYGNKADDLVFPDSIEVIGDAAESELTGPDETAEPDDGSSSSEPDVVIEPTVEPSINVENPKWTNKDIAVVDIEVDPLPDICEARIDSQREFIDVTNDLNFKIKENSILYVKATYGTGETAKEYTRSFIIDCFDRKAPTFSVTQNGLNLSFMARDDLSGVKAFYINNAVVENFSFMNANTASYTYRANRRETSIVVFAEDNAGNLSNMQTINIEENLEDSSSSSSSEEPLEDDVGAVGNAQITLTKPEWTNRKSVFVKVGVAGDKIDRIEAKSSRSAKWENITNTMDFKITDNTDVYVRATDTNGTVTTYTEYIECFDREGPAVDAIQDGESMNVITADELSGTDTIFVNGKSYPGNGGTASIPLNMGMTNMIVQAKDVAGNYSAVRTLAVDTSVFETIDPEIAAPAIEAMPPVPVTENLNGTVYNVVMSDGTSYSVEELQQMGIPIYVMTGVDEMTLRNMVQDVYNSQALEAEELPAEESVPDDSDLYDRLEGLLNQSDEESAEEPAPEDVPVDKEKSSPWGILVIGLFIVLIGAGALIYFKKVKAKFAKDDLYESEYDPNRDAYGGDDDADGLDLADADVSY